MQQDNKDLKKGVPGNFVLFLIAAVFIILMMQNFLDVKTAKVSFSYQLESLVNLDLLQPDDNRKTAINDNLVTFSGRFRERKTEEGKLRFKYLSLLDEHQLLLENQERHEDDIVNGRKQMLESANLFVQLAGIPVPASGYLVVGGIQDEAVTLKTINPRNVTSFASLQQRLAALKQSPSDIEVSRFGASLAELVKNLRSPILGIGSEKVKTSLRTISKNVSDANKATVSFSDKLNTYSQAMMQVSSIIQTLDQFEGNARLTSLRSVRKYQGAVADLGDLAAKLDENDAKLDKARATVTHVIWFFNNKELSSKSLEKQDVEAFNQWFDNAKLEWTDFEKNRGGMFKAPDQPLNAVLEKRFRSEEPPPKYLSYMFPALLAFGVIMVLYVLFARQMKGVGSGAMSFGKSPARLIKPGEGDDRVTFKDVAGIEEALEELEEIVDFLKNPQKFTALGGKIPKGVLCVGAPGTGKTLTAKAVAGEANCPFFFISGSDFVEMFVGVGASRIRDMFDQAKKNAPCIIFMDEIDAVGRHRGAGMGGGHDEREQTLNQLLVEMDGFDTRDGVILMAATNRPDVLDKALLRPGRFDRRVVINLPDIKGRHDILKVHAQKIKMDESVDLLTVARATPGSSGADLANILNEAALIAARRNRTAVTNQDVRDARDKVLYGKERRSLEVSEEEKKTTAYHEAGHTVVGLVVEHADPIDKVTIIPRGMSLGATMFLPEKNRTSYWKKEVIDQLSVLMGGRCAESIFVGDISSGAKQDLEQATHLARSMVCEWGMSDTLGPVAFEESNGSNYLGTDQNTKHYSEAKAKEIDAEMQQLLTTANQRAMDILEEHKPIVEVMTGALMEFETIDSRDLKEMMDGSWTAEKKRQRLNEEEELHKKEAAKVTPPEEGGQDTPPPVKDKDHSPVYP